MTELVDVLEQQYLSRLALRCTEWQVRHPEEAREIRETVTQQFRVSGRADPDPGSLQWQMIEAAVNEAIRAKAGWPTVRTWMQGKGMPTPPMPTRSPAAGSGSSLERHDHKALASGDR